jgi:hypothetical protein
MGKRGPKPACKVNNTWSPYLAYAIGLFTGDGCLQKGGRHLDFTSKEREQVELFRQCLGLTTKIGVKYSGAGNKAYRIQFGDVLVLSIFERDRIVQCECKDHRVGIST